LARAAFAAATTTVHRDRTAATKIGFLFYRTGLRNDRCSAKSGRPFPVNAKTIDAAHISVNISGP
jgi:hypothetical protein